MKLFNWMQRRFHHTAFKDEVAKNVNKAELVDAFDGILTIGTLGLDPLRPFNQHNEYIVLEESDIGYYDEEEEHESYSVDDDDDDDDDDGNVNRDEEENPLIFTRLEHKYEEIGSNLDANHCEESVDCDVQRKGKGERITLAELFMADSDMKKKHDLVQEIETTKLANKKICVRAKNGLSFAKKFIPLVKEDSRPIKKIQQLMKRMLKRKIHPEIEGKGNATDNQNNAATVQVGLASKGNKISESISLLPALLVAGPTV